MCFRTDDRDGIWYQRSLPARTISRVRTLNFEARYHPLVRIEGGRGIRAASAFKGGINGGVGHDSDRTAKNLGACALGRAVGRISALLRRRDTASRHRDHLATPA